jgi:hypothetical protein
MTHIESIALIAASMYTKFIDYTLALNGTVFGEQATGMCSKADRAGRLSRKTLVRLKSNDRMFSNENVFL